MQLRPCFTQNTMQMISPLQLLNGIIVIVDWVVPVFDHVSPPVSIQLNMLTPNWEQGTKRRRRRSWRGSWTRSWSSSASYTVSCSFVCLNFRPYVLTEDLFRPIFQFKCSPEHSRQINVAHFLLHLRKCTFIKKKCMHVYMWKCVYTYMCTK